MDVKEAVRAHTLATSIFRHLASLQNEIPPLRAPQQSASQITLPERQLERHPSQSDMRLHGLGLGE